MVPSACETLERLPLTPDGKVDRKALPAPSATAWQQTVSVTLQGEVEERIAEIWQKLLRVEQVGRHENFFDLGGHSLLVVQAYAQICETFGTEFPILRLFQYPTVSSLAKFLEQESKEKVSF